MLNRGSVPVLDALVFVRSSNQCFRIETISVSATSLLTYLLVWSSVPCEFMLKRLHISCTLPAEYFMRGLEGVSTHGKRFAESFQSGGDLAGVWRKAEVEWNFVQFSARCAFEVIVLSLISLFFR